MSVTIRLASLLTLSASLLVFPGCESSCNQPLSSNPSGTAGDNAAPGVETGETKLVSFKVDGMTVFVKYKGDLDLDSTLKAISRAGFEAQEVAN